MVSIRDLDDSQFVTEIELRGKKVEVWPLTFDDLLYLLRKFPVLAQALEEQRLTPEIIAQLPEATAVIAEAIACASRDSKEQSLRGDLIVIRRCLRLSAMEQMAFATKLLEISLPEGPRPFAEKLSALWSWLGVSTAAQEKDGAAQLESSSQTSISAELVGSPRPMRKRRPLASSQPSTPSPAPSITNVSQTTPVLPV